jgi:hypothetical protein
VVVMAVVMGEVMGEAAGVMVVALRHKTAPH